MAVMGKRALNVWLSDEARAGWKTFASSHDISVTALVEAVGLVLGSDRRPSRRLVSELVEIARQVDTERRSRRR